MTMRHKKHADGTYHIHGRRYRTVRGSRAQVMHRNAYKTVGDLKKDDLKYNKSGKIVSRRKSEKAKKEKRLQEHVRNNLGSITLAKLNKLPFWLTTISIKDFDDVVTKIKLTKQEESRKRKLVSSQNVQPRQPKV